ncbi:MAG: hypothetical protein K9I74_12300 [Bacteroidales bacterium]|nr:hypothetical protein [Bacteroidales bacterium]
MKRDHIDHETIEHVWELKKSGMDVVKVFDAVLKWADQGITQAEIMRPENIERLRAIGRGEVAA